MTGKSDLFSHPTTISRSQGELNSALIQRDVDYFLTQLEHSRAQRATGARNGGLEAMAVAALRSIWERVDMSFLEDYGKEEYDKIEAALSGANTTALNTWKQIKAFLYIKGIMKFDTSKVVNFADLEEVNKFYGH